jgi:hypothetical protein
MDEEELERAHDQALAQALNLIPSDRLEARLMVELAPLLNKRGSAAAAQLAAAKPAAMRKIAEEELAAAAAKRAEDEAAKPSADQLARERVVRMVAAGVTNRLATMTEDERAAWQTEVDAIRVGLTGAEARRDVDQAAQYHARLAELGADSPAEGSPEWLAIAILPEPLATGIQVQPWFAELDRLRAEFGIDEAAITRLKDQHGLGDGPKLAAREAEVARAEAQIAEIRRLHHLDDQPEPTGRRRAR